MLVIPAMGTGDLTDKTEFFRLPENLPNRDHLIDLLLQAGADIVENNVLLKLLFTTPNLLDVIPVPALIMDVTQVQKILSQFKNTGITDIQEFYTQNPESLAEMKVTIQLEWINQMGCHFWGLRDFTQSRQHLSEILFSKSDFLLKGILQLLWEDQSLSNLSGDVLTITGQKKHVDIACKIFPDIGQNSFHALLFLNDTSKYQEVMSRQSLLEILYHTIIDINSDFAYAISVSNTGKYQVEWISDSFTNTTGFSINEILKPEIVRSAIFPEDYPIFQDAVEKILMGQVITFESRIITKAGKIRWMRSTTRPVEPRINGYTRVIVGTVTDVTDRKEAEITHRKTQVQLQVKVRELEARTREITLLTAMTNNLQLCQTTNEAFDIVAEAGANLFPKFSGTVYVRSIENKNYQPSAYWGQPPDQVSITHDDCWAIRRAAPFLVHTREKTLRCSHSKTSSPGVSSLCMPVIQQGDTIGLLYIESAEPRNEIDQTAIRILASMAEQFGLAMTNIHLRESLAEQALHDPLTGLYNRYYMEEFLEKELHRARRSNKPVSLIMIDMDHFRDLNALFGHPNVDLALEEVGHLLANSIRAGDVACRYGGDEFLLILPEATTDVAVARAKNLCQTVHSVVVRSETRPPHPISFSVGVASFPAHGTTVSDLLQAADSAVFLAKDQGRDRVEIAV